jgi:hypothetical protein
MSELNSSNGPAYLDGSAYPPGNPVRTNERERNTRGPDFLHSRQDRSNDTPIVLPRWKGKDEDYEEVRRDFPPPERPGYMVSPPSPPHRMRAKTTPQFEQRTYDDRYREVDEVVWDVSRAKDITMQLELDIAEDLEPELDEFCRLTRLGNFRDAKQFFRANLEQYMDDPYVFVQYAQMLMVMGDFRSVEVRCSRSLFVVPVQEIQMLNNFIQHVCSFSVLRACMFAP